MGCERVIVEFVQLFVELQRILQRLETVGGLVGGFCGFGGG